MRFLFGFLVVVFCAIPCLSQTLAEELKSAGVPANSFRSSELAETVNAAYARRGELTYLVYMRVGANQSLTGSPQIVRYDANSGTVKRKEVQLEKDESGFGSPEGIFLTPSFELASFNISPSANKVLVFDLGLSPVWMLYGFGLYEIAPDQVIYTENMVHFAPAHPERLRFLNLDSGATMELYPPREDPLRAEFARLHKEHMPPAAVCEREDDPCLPSYYDEYIQFLSVERPSQFTIRVDRSAAHEFHKDQPPKDVASQSAVYVYSRSNGNWLYCEVRILPQGLKTPKCEPNVPVVANPPAFPNVSPAVVRIRN